MKRILFSLVLLCPICVFAQKKNELAVAFYNTENLYDTLNDTSVDDEEFLPEGKNNWTGERYQKKLGSLARVIDSVGGGPDILGLCEVENKTVLEDLIREKRLSLKGYAIVHENSPDKRGIDVALIYRKKVFKPVFHKMLRIQTGDPDFITRDIMMVKGELNKKSLYVFVNHWPSRRGGEEESRPKRKAAALTLRQTIDTILNRNPDAALLLMGDFNDSPFDESLKKDLMAADTNQFESKKELYNAMARLARSGDGSHMYKGKWDMLDQLIVSQGLLSGQSGLKWESQSASVYRRIWMQDKYAKEPGEPYRTYGGPKYKGGYSDHFPVYGKISY
jgi:predicted extracellular nuclease